MNVYTQKYNRTKFQFFFERSEANFWVIYNNNSTVILKIHQSTTNYSCWWFGLYQRYHIIINMKPSPTKWVCLLIRLLACVQMISTSFVFSNFIKNLFVAKSSSRCLLVPKDTYFQWFNVALHCTVSLYFVKGKSRERITRSSADVDKLARSVQVTKHSTIPYVSYSFLLVW